jgi:hypothetical protein
LNSTTTNSSTVRSVFISHASKNFKVADEIRGILETRGVSCWIAPRDIAPGQQYGTSIIDGISNSSIFLLLLTNESNLSSAVQNEVERAFGYQKTIIPVRISDVKPGKEIEFFVSNAQWVDAIYQPLKRRMDQVAAIVQAIEMSAKPPPIQPDKKTLLGSIEKFFERAFRHKTLSVFTGFVAVIALTAFGIQVQTLGVERVHRASVKIEQSGEKINTAAASIQESSSKVAALDSTLKTLKKEVSDDPRKELVSRGYSVDSRGFRKAIAQRDVAAIEHFNAANYATTDPEVIRELFRQSWDAKVAFAIDPKIVASVCNYTPVGVLIDPLDGYADWVEELHVAKLKAMQRLCGTDTIRELLAPGPYDEANRIANEAVIFGEKEKIEAARLQINPYKYSKAAQHQKPAVPAYLAAREFGEPCGSPRSTKSCTYAGEGLSPGEFKELERQLMLEFNTRQSEAAATQTQIKKYLAKLN